MPVSRFSSRPASALIGHGYNRRDSSVSAGQTITTGNTGSVGTNASRLGRPCQFEPGLVAQTCHSRDWTQARFSPTIVAALDQGVSQLKQMFGAARLVLVGDSGGGILAATMSRCW